MAMSVPSALEPPRTETVYLAPEGGRDPLIKLTPARKRVLDQLEGGPALPMAELCRLVGVGSSVIKAMVQAGLLGTAEPGPRPAFAPPDGARPGPLPSPGQAAPGQGL